MSVLPAHNYIMNGSYYIMERYNMMKLIRQDLKFEFFIFPEISSCLAFNSFQLVQFALYN